MFDTLLAKVIGTKNERELKKLRPMIEQINALEPEVSCLSDEQLRAKTAEFRTRFQARVEAAAAEDRAAAVKAALEEALPEAFAVVRETGKRVLSMRHFDVQLIGGIVLHQGKIAEMKTGEGKTLVATLPVYLNALEGKGVHVVTVNDYLARRDAEWMGKIYRFLGLTVGVIQHELNDAERQVAYGSDVTYGTNNEFGFDYLRDNMKFELAQYVQRGHHFAVVDEVDSILIDEARTPLIISGPAEESTELYYNIDRIIPKLKRGAVIRGDVRPEEREALEASGDYIVDEKAKTVALTEAGIAKGEKLLAIDNLYDPQFMPVLHHIHQALKAHTLFKRDVDYVVKDGQVIIVDEFTGRLMPGRRWSEGLHQAVEAKERVKIERENQTLATITFQNYFRMYKKLAGMTGTADTEAEEFAKIYNLDVVVIPTNRPLRRTEFPDVVYRTEREKFDAVVREIEELHQNGQPVLVGTISIEKSERLSDMLRRRGIKHHVLNAKQHEREAEIVAQAGRDGAVTIATNMAGRGTDILLGGNPEFLAKQWLFERESDPAQATPVEWEQALAGVKPIVDEEHVQVVNVGGLHILGTERHEARRIDNQLRGRAGRQGDPGSSRFYLSLEDDLMRIFGSDRISGLMQRLGMEEGVPIEHRMVTNAIERAQKQVEAQNFSVRKHLLEYDDVMNKQREAIYSLRREILEGTISARRAEEAEEEETPEGEGQPSPTGQRDYILELAESLLDDNVALYCPSDREPSEWDIEGLKQFVGGQYAIDPRDQAGIDFPHLNRQEIKEALWQLILRRYEEKERLIGRDIMRFHERVLMLQIVDAQWKDHLYAMDHLKEGIGLRGYGQRDPLVEYKKESFEMFQAMWSRIEEEIARYLWWLRPVIEERAPQPGARQRPRARSEHAATQLFFNSPTEAAPAFAMAGSAAAVGGGAPTPARTGGDDTVRTVRRSGEKIGRNDPCPCGSGKKYKKCHGA